MGLITAAPTEQARRHRCDRVPLPMVTVRWRSALLPAAAVLLLAGVLLATLGLPRPAAAQSTEEMQQKATAVAGALATGSLSSQYRIKADLALEILIGNSGGRIGPSLEIGLHDNAGEEADLAGRLDWVLPWPRLRRTLVPFRFTQLVFPLGVRDRVLGLTWVVYYSINFVDRQRYAFIDEYAVPRQIVTGIGETVSWEYPTTGSVRWSFGLDWGGMVIRQQQATGRSSGALGRGTIKDERFSLVKLRAGGVFLF